MTLAPVSSHLQEAASDSQPANLVAFSGVHAAVRYRSGLRRQTGVMNRRSNQKGAALVVALILLIVITLVGFAAMRGTILQQKMAANLYDREVAFQSAEAALRTAAALIPSTPAIVARNCQAGGVVCQANPFSDPGLPAGSIQNVGGGTALGQFTASLLGTGQPQYVVENMGKWAVPGSSTGFSHSANSHNYGASGGAITAIYYRVTARSGDPSVVGDRAVVVLQAMIKQG